MNQILQPYLNPEKFVAVQPADVPQYISRHMDDWLFKNTQRSFEQPVNFLKPWLMDDSIRLQFTSNFVPLTLKLFTCKGKEVYSLNIDTKQQDFFKPDFFIRQVELDLGSLNLDAGEYYLRIPEASWIAEPFELLEEAENTCYLEYKNSNFYSGVNFNIPFAPAIRVPGILKYEKPGSRDVIYPDQDESETILSSVPYRVVKFILGGQRGVPPWMIDKVARIFGCDELKIDGRLYTKADGANWEPIGEINGYPMSGWSIELREKLNRDSLIYENDVEIMGVAAAGLIVDTKGFGMDDETSNDYLEIDSLT
jgi:hypothetical protein